MESAIPVRRLWYYLTLVWLLIGVITHLSAILWMFQYGEEVTLYRIVDLGFYYYWPVILWTLYTPVLLRGYQRWPLSGPKWKRNLFYHLLFSLAFAPVARLLAILLDFSGKNLIGWEVTPAWEIVYEALYIVLASAPRALLSYWVVIGAVIIWKYLILRNQAATRLRPKKPSRERILVPHKSAKKMIDVQDIFWIEADRNYVNIHTSDNSFKLRCSLASLYGELDGQQFFRIHRSRIINRAAIESLSHWRRGEYLIRLKNDKLVSSGRTYRHSIKEILAIYPIR